MCNIWWRAIIEQTAIISMWGWVTSLFRLCVAQPCTWWCLCCNVWLCVFLDIILAALILIFTILTEVGFFIILTSCEISCMTITVLQRGANFMCFAYAAPAQPASSGVPAAPPSQPISIFSGGPYSGLIGQPIAMAATLSGATNPALLTISWDFGDGSKAEGLTVSHAYSDVRQFTVVVSVIGQTVVGTGVIATATTTANLAGEGTSGPIG